MVDVHYVPRMCNHCDDAPCIEAAGDAIVKRPDGIVIVDPDKAKGRRDLVDACLWCDQVERGRASAAELDFRRASARSGLDGAARRSCLPTRAMQALNVADEAMAKMARDEGATGSGAGTWYATTGLVSQS